MTSVSGTPPGAAWHAAWLDESRSARATLWRGVEAQHRIATLRVVDTVEEQDLLEQVLEASKPPWPRECEGLHYLLATPFRYASPWPSRFRAPGDPGVWYGAQRLATACAETGYWRWRFAQDSDGLRGLPVLGELTFFEATASGRRVDLTRPPWDRLRSAWTADADYASCQALARAARAAGVAWIRYHSVRDPAHGPCGAVLEPSALALGDLTRQQTWAYKVTGGTVLMRPLGVASPAQPLTFGFG